MKTSRRLFACLPLFFCLSVSCAIAVQETSELPSAADALSAPPTAAQLATVPQEFATFTPIPVISSTLTPSPTPSPTPTFTPQPSATPTPLPTLEPTNTLAPTLVPATATISAALDCPEEPPAYVTHNKYWLGSEKWPTPVPNPQPHFEMMKPLPGGGRYLINQTFPYGWDLSGRLALHNGVDSGGGGLGTELPAVGDGTIVTARSDEEEWWGLRCDWYGHLVVLELDRKFEGKSVYALYGHVLNIAVEEGQRVKKGETVAEVGFGGAASVAHLHFEVRVGKNDYESTRNPMLWVAPPETRGLIVGRLISPNGRPWQGVWINARSLTESGVEQVTWSYLDDPRSLINPDERYAENFVFNDVLPGTYRLALEIEDVRYTADVEVFGGEISTVEIVTQSSE